jgi:hypothetical protein
MQIFLTERFLRDFQDLSSSLANKCRKLIGELHQVEAAELRQKALPGWRLHSLHGSNMVSLSVDMNTRMLGELDRDALIAHRVVKHDSADRADVNRNDRAEAITQMTTAKLLLSGVYDALRSFGVTEAEAERFRGCSTEDDLLLAAADVSTATGNLALTLYETSGLVIPQARFRVLHRHEDFARILEVGGDDWEIYLHPSQAFLVELPASFQAAVVGSAGTGKTVCAWHRSKHLIDGGVSVGFVCPHESVLDISKKHMLDMVDPRNNRSYFFVPKNPDELIQLAEVVDHVIVDEAQEIPATWLLKLSEKIGNTIGLTLFYDLNQLGGNIKNGDVARYRRRIADWKMMLGRFPRMHKFSLCINYRNAREIAEHYLAMLSEALPAKPSADVPVFETGEVVHRRVNREELNDVLASLVRRLLHDHVPQEIGVVILDQGSEAVLRALAGRNLPVTDDPAQNAAVITTASRIRGHERQVMIVTTKNADALRRNYGVAIDSYIAMSRAVKRLFVLEAAS